MTKRTYKTKAETEFEWVETEETKKALEELHKFAGNYQGPLYAPHPDLKNENASQS